MQAGAGDDEPCRQAQEMAQSWRQVRMMVLQARQEDSQGDAPHPSLLPVPQPRTQLPFPPSPHKPRSIQAPEVLLTLEDSSLAPDQRPLLPARPLLAP